MRRALGVAPNPGSSPGTAGTSVAPSDEPTVRGPVQRSSSIVIPANLADCGPLQNRPSPIAGDAAAPFWTRWSPERFSISVRCQTVAVVDVLRLVLLGAIDEEALEGEEAARMVAEGWSAVAHAFWDRVVDLSGQTWADLAAAFYGCFPRIDEMEEVKAIWPSEPLVAVTDRWHLSQFASLFWTPKDGDLILLTYDGPEVAWLDSHVRLRVGDRRGGSSGDRAPLPDGVPSLSQQAAAELPRFLEEPRSATTT